MRTDTNTHTPPAASLPPEVFLRDEASPSLLSLLPMERNSLSVATGRSALAKALDAASGKALTGRAWLPSLCCASLAPVFLQRGFSLSFYSTAPFALPGLERGDVFLYIHFCGFPNRAAEQALGALPEERRPVVVEDCVHALFTRGTGGFGDFALYSFRKFLPVPDGGLLLSREPVDETLSPPLERFISLKTAGLLSGSRRLLEEGEAALDADDEAREPSAMGALLLDRLPWKHIPEVRRNNYAFLAERLRLPPLDDDTVPLGVPLRVPAGKGELERRLRAAGFEPPISWDVPRDAPSDEADRLVVLPCDERMGERELLKMINIRASMNEKKSGRVPLYNKGGRPMPEICSQITFFSEYTYPTGGERARLLPEHEESKGDVR